MISLDLDKNDGPSESGEALAKVLSARESNTRHEDMIGWVNLPFEDRAQKESLKWARSISPAQTHLCVLGIGGSVLGTQAIYSFLQPKKPVTFLTNVDGYEIERKFASFNFKKTHFVAISKSGETSETLIQLGHLLSIFKKKKLKVKDHLSVITEDKPSSLREMGKLWECRFLPVPRDVGGRFSVFSNVGLAPLSWAGVNVRQILDGAKTALKLQESISELSDFYLKTFSDQKWISVFWIYCEGLKTFGLWLEQLWSESLAKKMTLANELAPRVSTPLVCAGPNDQHSLLQQFVEGAQDKSFLFIRNKESEKSSSIGIAPAPQLKLFEKKSVGGILGLQVQATRLCLKNKKIPSAEIQVLDHRPKSIGALIYFFELLVATIAQRLNINAYNQPGVEEVKKVVLGTLGDSRYLAQALKSKD